MTWPVQEVVVRTRRELVSSGAGDLPVDKGRARRTLGAMVEQAGFRVIRSEPQGRYLRLGYLATRVSGLSPLLGRALGGLFRVLRLDAMPIPINFGDLFTVYARKV